MTCEEFAIAALDLGSNAANDTPEQRAAREHLRHCSHCAALQEQWEALRTDLQSLGQENSEAAAPARVEMRLLQEFRTKHRTMKTRRAAVAATWALAAAAVLLVAVSWVLWRHDGQVAKNHPVVAPQTSAQQSPVATSEVADETLVASNGSDFALLPGSVPSATEDATVVHVQMQRAALSALGLTVNEEHAADWIQVDLLVGDDGVPQAVRLPKSSN